MADPVMVEFGAKIDGLVTGVDQIKTKLGELNESTASIGAGFGRLGEFIAAAFSVEKITQFIERMAELGLQTERTMAQLGLSAQETLQLGGMAKLTGTSMDGLALSLERMYLNVQKSTKDGLNPAAQALKVLGLNAKDLLGTPTSEYLDKLHDAVVKLEPSLNRTTAIMAVGGRGVAQLIPLLDVSSERWGEMKHAIDAANGGLAGAIPGMAETHQAITLMELSVRSLGASLFSQLNPAIDGIVHALTDFVQYLREAGKAGGALEWTFTVITTAAKLLASAIVATISAFLGLGVAVEGLFKVVAGKGTDLETNAKKTAESIEKIGRDLKKNLEEIWSTPLSITVHPKRTDAGTMNFGAGEAMQAAITAAQNQIKLADMVYQQTTDRIKHQYGDFIFTEGAKTAALGAALDQRYALEMDAIEKEKKAAAGSPSAYAKVLAEKLMLDQKYAMDKQKLIEASAMAEEKSWNNLFQGIQSAFDSQLRGLLAGTTTWTQAMKAALGNFVIWAITQFEKMAFEWAAHELAETAATEAGVAARATAETSGTAASMGLNVLKIIKSIMNSAAETFAGVFGFLSPVMGPAAAGPATASASLVAAAAAGVSAFDVGTDYVARTGLAIIHQGEKITPAQGTGPYTGAGGGTNVTLNIQAVDARSFASLLNSNPGLFANLIKRSMRDGQLNLAPAR